MKKLILTTLAASMLTACAFSAVAEEEIKIVYNGEEIACDVSPFIENERTMVPARAVFEKMGATVEYGSDEDGQYVWIHTDDDRYIDLTIGSDEIRHGYGYMSHILFQKIDTPAMIRDDRTFIPLRAVAELMDVDVQWDGETRTVTMTSAPDPTEIPAVPISFADEMNRKMPQDKNYMFSPLSIKTALAMAANGADGDTKTQILETLGIDDLDAYNKKMKGMIKSYAENDLINVSIANSIWCNTSRNPQRFSDSFKKTIKDLYNGEAAEVTDADAVDRINGWVSDHTNEKIPSIINTPDFGAALINAVYFKANWADEFATAADMMFTERGGETAEVKAMVKADSMNYAEYDGCRLVEIPYKHYNTVYDDDWNVKERQSADEMAMYLVMPLSDGGEQTAMQNPVQALDNAAFANRRVILTMPKFRIEFSASLTDTLKAMGMEKPFTDAADFTPMVDSGSMKISDVLHKTYIDVDEKGTEAAAVTAVMMKPTAVMPSEPPIEFTVDHPFAFIIKDKTNDEVLFMGEFAYAK